MTVCPIAIAVHCTGCPVVKVCPARTVLGDYGKQPDPGNSGKEERPRKES